ncbi:MAG: hypothetical protein ACPLXO_00940 [Desulfurella sp.]|jgi:transcription termination factor NusB
MKWQKTDKYETRKCAIFYLYSNYFNQDNLDSFLSFIVNKNLDRQYLNMLISLYNDTEQKYARKILNYVLKKNDLTVFHIVFILVMLSENYVVSFTENDIRDYVMLADRYGDNLLVNIIFFFKKNNLLKMLDN